jgi:membrane associated rhomboid family serine protease
MTSPEPDSKRILVPVAQPPRPQWAQWQFDPADFAEDAEPRKPSAADHPLGQRLQFSSARPALLLLAICTFFSLWYWQFVGGTVWPATRDAVYQSGEYWRLVTTLFVHADIGHLLANTGLFLVFGTLLRHYFGFWAFPLLSLLGGIVTAALALLTYPGQVRLIGASGMVYFMAALWLFLFCKHADYLSWVQRSMRAIAFILVVLVPTQIEPTVSYRSHAIGFGLGLFFAWLSSPWLKPRPLPPAEEQHKTPPRSADEDDDILPPNPYIH